MTRRGLAGPAGYWVGFVVVLGLLTVAPLVLPEFWRRFVTEILIWGLLAMSSDLVSAAVVAAFVAYFATRLRDIYFAITTLVFSQIFYVIIFTWTDVTGGE